MEHHLLKCSCSHFKQAHGTPFTTPPLSDLLGFNSLMPFGEQITKGAPIPPEISLDPATRLLLSIGQLSSLQPSCMSILLISSFSWKASKNGPNEPPHLPLAGTWACTNPCSKIFLLAKILIRFIVLSLGINKLAEDQRPALWLRGKSCILITARWLVAKRCLWPKVNRITLSRHWRHIWVT